MHKVIEEDSSAPESIVESIRKLKYELDATFEHPTPAEVMATHTSATNTSITIRNLKKSYGNRQVLRGIHLDIQAGEFVAIVGRSGCGKSTILRLLGGLEMADGGSIESSHALTSTRVMFQDARLLPWKSVLENVALGTGDKAAAEAVLQRVALQDRKHDWPAVLSGGQKQRVALARALVHQPDLLLLDEPLGALDALTRIEMQALIESLWLAQGFTAVLVTHDVHEAVALADRVILIENGQITLNESIDLPRPRLRSDASFAMLEEKILHRVLQHGVNA